MDNQRPSRVWTLFATATWVCRSGSPARLSRWVNATATRPRTLTCRMPCGPVRVNRACFSISFDVMKGPGGYPDDYRYHSCEVDAELVAGQRLAVGSLEVE